MDFAEEISKLRTISESVDQYVANGMYLQKYDSVDMITDQLILNDCYEVLLQELQLIGIVPVVSIEELLSDYYLAEALASVRVLFDKDKLRDIFCTNANFKEMIIAMLDQDNLADENCFSEFLDTYQRFFPGDKNLEIIQRIEHNLNSTFELVNHLDHISHMSIAKSDIPEDMTEMKEFLNRIVQGREYYEKAIKHILKIDSSLNMDYLDHTIKLYDIEKITGENLNKFCWAVMTDPETLHPEMQKKQNEFLFMHKSSTSHHIEYYIANRKKPTREQLAELVAHHYEPGSTVVEFCKAVEDMLIIGATIKNSFSVFDENDHGYILRLMREIKTLYTE